MNDIVCLKLITGEEVVAEIVERSNAEDGNTTIQNPVSVVAANGQAGFAPWFPIAKKKEPISIPNRMIIAVASADDGVVDAYSSVFGKIVTPSPQIITG